MHSTSDEEVDVESTVSKRKGRTKTLAGHKRRRKDERRSQKASESPSPVAKKVAHSPSPASSPLKAGYKVPDEMGLKSEDDDVMVSSVQKYVAQLSQGLGLVPQAQPGKGQSAKKRKQKKESESSSEEERWLDAIQSGKLEEVDEELKKVKPKDPKLMTARQRAMFERKGDRDAGEQLMSLPSGYKEVVMTAEAIQRKAIKSQKRKEKADEKREKDKKKTMERLLKKQESKSLKSGPKRSNRKNWPLLTYCSTVDGPKIHLPPGFPYPMTAQKAAPPPKPQRCGVKGCKNRKKYSCSKTGVSLCSLECYKKNILISEVVS